MVDIREINARISDSGSMREVATQFMELRSAQAVAVRVMPWLLLAADDPRDFDFYSGWPYFGSGPLAERIFAGRSDWHRFQSAAAEAMADVDRRFNKWQSAIGGPFEYPFHLMLHFNAAVLQPDELERARAILREHPDVFATIERRSPMRLQLASGDKIHSGGLGGTVGGFIDDGGTLYGLTCSHVIAATRVDDANGNQVGTAGAKSAPAMLASGSVCTPFPPPGATAGPVNSGDFALIAISAKVSGSGLVLTTALHQGDTVTVAAGSSRYSFQVRSLCIAMRLAFGGTNYCFAPLVELYSSAGTTWPGDSGAWGLRSTFSEWAAMIAGADSISSFAFDARDIAKWIDGCGSVTAGGWKVY